MPKWAHTTNELFYVNGNREMVAAQFEADGETFRVAELQVLFELPDNIFYAPNENYALYDVDVDDRRFIWMQNLIDDVPYDIVLIDNWISELVERSGN